MIFRRSLSVFFVSVLFATVYGTSVDIVEQQDVQKSLQTDSSLQSLQSQTFQSIVDPEDIKAMAIEASKEVKVSSQAQTVQATSSLTVVDSNTSQLFALPPSTASSTTASSTSSVLPTMAVIVPDPQGFVSMQQFEFKVAQENGGDATYYCLKFSTTPLRKLVKIIQGVLLDGYKTTDPKTRPLMEAEIKASWVTSQRYHCTVSQSKGEFDKTVLSKIYANLELIPVGLEFFTTKLNDDKGHLVLVLEDKNKSLPDFEFKDGLSKPHITLAHRVSAKAMDKTLVKALNDHPKIAEFLKSMKIMPQGFCCGGVGDKDPNAFPTTPETPKLSSPSKANSPLKRAILEKDQKCVAAIKDRIKTLEAEQKNFAQRKVQLSKLEESLKQLFVKLEQQKKVVVDAETALSKAPDSEELQKKHKDALKELEKMLKSLQIVEKNFKTSSGHLAEDEPRQKEIEAELEKLKGSISDKGSVVKTLF